MSDLQLEIRANSVAVLTLDQLGSKANVLAPALWKQLEAAIDSLVERTDVVGLIFASAKPDIFIAGADLKLLANAAGPHDPAVRGFIQDGLRVLAKLEALPFPTLAAINGVALGGGLEVALACDFRFAGPNPKLRFGLPEVSLGLIPGWGGTQRLPRIVGVQNATDLVALGQPIDRNKASQIQLIDHCVSEGTDFIATAVAYLEKRPSVDEIRRKKQGEVKVTQGQASTTAEPAESRAVAEARRVISAGCSLNLVDAISLETEAFMQLAGSDESKRLIAAFFAGRKKA